MYKKIIKMHMNSTVLITGANSFIAKHLTHILKEKYNIKYLTRTPKNENEFAWNLENWTIDEKALDDVDYIVHLSGSKLNDGTPLTPDRQKLVRDTRIGAANFLREKLKERNQTLKAFVSASAIGYYGFTESNLEIDENGNKGLGFSAELSDDWEKAADLFKTDHVADHVSKIRVSLVLGNEGGILPVFKGMIQNNPNIVTHSQTDVFLWNHVEDMAGIFAFALENNLDGVFNSVAPEPASTQDVFKAISNKMNGTNYEIKPFQGQHLVSNKIINAGYQFKFPNIEGAIKNLIN